MAKAAGGGGGGGAAGGFRIATGFVDVLGRTNRAQIRTTATKVGQESGRQMATAMGAATSTALARNTRGQFVRPLAAAGEAAGAAAAAGAASAAAQGAHALTQTMTAAGDQAGKALTAATTKSAPTVTKTMGKTGDQAGKAFTAATTAASAGVTPGVIGHARRAGRAALDAVMGGFSPIGGRMGMAASLAGKRAGDQLISSYTPALGALSRESTRGGKLAGERLARAFSPGTWLMAATAVEAGRRAGRNVTSGLQAGASRVGQVATGIGQTISTRMTGTVGPAAQRMSAAVGTAAGRAGNLMQTAFGRPIAAIGAGFSGLSQGFGRVVTSIRSGATATTGALGGIAGGFTGMAGIAAAALGAIGIGKFVAGVFEMSTAINEARASLTGMYGSASQANEMVASINTEFRRSTVGVGVLNKLASNLAYLGFEGEEAVNMIRNIDIAASALPGDAAAAVDSVSNALLTAQVQGNAFVGDLNMISRVGFPIFDALAEHIGVTSGEIKDMASQGEISFEDLMHVMNDPSMSQYWEMTEEAAKNTSQTFRQSFMGMVNAAQVSVAEIVDAILSRMAPGMNRVADIVDNAFLRLPAAMSNAKDGLERAGVLTAVRNIFGSIKDFVLGALPAVRGFTEGFAGAFAALTVVLDPILRGLRPIGQWMQDNEGPVRVFGIAVGFVAAAFVIAKVAAAGFAAAAGVVLSPVLLVAAALGVVAGAIYLAWQRSETFRTGVVSAWEVIKSAWMSLWEGYLQPGLQALGDLWDRIWPRIKEVAGNLWDGLVAGWNTVWSKLGPGLEALVGIVRDKWPAVKETAQDIFGSMTAYAEEIQPKFQRIFDAVTYIVQDAIAWIQGFWEDHGDKIMGFLDFLWTTVGGIFRGAFTMIGGIVMGAWQIISGIFSGALDVIGGLLDVFIGVFTGDWARAWDGVKAIFSGLWTAVVAIFNGAVSILGGIVMGLIEAVKAPFLWLWNWLVGNSLVPDLVNAVVAWFTLMRDWVTSLLGLLRDWAVARFLAMRDRAVAAVLNLRDRVVAFFTNLRDRGRALFEALRDMVVARVFALRDRVVAGVLNLRDRAVNAFINLRDRARNIAENLRDWVVSRVHTLRDRIVGAFERIRDRAISAFDKARAGIKRVWDKVKKAAKDPVNFVIGTVYTDGIKKFWDSIASKVGMSKLPSIKKLERGGKTQGGTPGVDSIPALLMADEYVLRKSSAKSIGYDNLEFMNRTGELPPVQKFNRGGIVSAVGDFLTKGKDFFADGFMKALRGVTGPIKNSMNELFGRSGFKGMPTRVVEHLIGKLEDFLTPFESELSGGNGKKVVQIARDQVGISGRPNKFTAPFFSAAWCGMFVDWVFKKAGAGKALSGVKNGWTPLVSNYTSLPRVSKANARPGDLPLYRGDSGHVNILTDPKTSETVGGNESDSVRKNFGYVNSASSIRRPKFAMGGQVDQDMVQAAGGLAGLRDVVWQDHTETPFEGQEGTQLRDLFTKPGWAGHPTGLTGASATHDDGGVVLDDHAAVNRKGEAELMVLREEMRAWAAAARNGGDTYINVTVDLSKVRNLNDLLRLVENLQQSARAHGARTRVGAP